MKSVVLVQPSGGYWDRLQGTGLPLSTLQASVLAAQEYDLVLFDARLHRDWRARLAKLLVERQPMLVGTTVMLGPQLGEAMAINRMVKRLVPTARTAWGGTFPTIATELAMQAPDLDYLIVRDGEEALLGLARWIDAEGAGPGAGRPDVPNVRWRDASGALAGTFAAHPVDLEALPPLPYHLLELDAYARRFKGGGVVSLETSRGCVLDCTYCYNQTMSRRRWRRKSAGRIRADLADLARHFPKANVFVMDDNFFVDLERAASVGDELARAGRRWGTHGLTPIDVARFDAPYVAHLAETGCYELRVGLDNAAESNMARMNKRYDKAAVREANRVLAAHDILVQYALVFGFPGETDDDLRENLRFVLGMLDDNPRAALFMIAVLFPFPGTDVYERHTTPEWKAEWGLEQYARFQVNHPGRPWLTAERWKLLSRISLASLFVSEKRLSFAPGWSLLLEIVRRSYAPIARRRLERFSFGFAPELALANALLENAGRALWRLLRLGRAEAS